MEAKQLFETAVREHGPTVLRVCSAVLGPGADAEEAWSETFLAALQVWPTLEAATNLQAWLVRVAHRKAVDVLRGRSRHATPVARPPETISTIGNPGAGDDGLLAAIASLPERQRLAVAYHHLGGLPHAEIAEITASTPAAVRRASADGIRALRRLLADHGSDRRRDDDHR